jgi:zinc D-Ala-D-Ala carboxypeptidase
MFFQHHRDVPARIWKWPNFTPAEIASPGDGSILIHFDAMDRLQTMREIIGKPLIINSAYRDPIHNAKVGGAPLSEHKFGKAFDVSSRGHDRMALVAAAKEAGFTGIGYYNTWLHVDTGRKRQWGKVWE